MVLKTYNLISNTVCWREKNWNCDLVAFGRHCPYNPAHILAPVIYWTVPVDSHQTFFAFPFEFTSITLTSISLGCIEFSLMFSPTRESLHSSLKLPLNELLMVCWPLYIIWELPSLVLRRIPNRVGRLNCLFTWIQWIWLIHMIG